MSTSTYRIVIRHRDTGDVVETVNEYDGQPFTPESAEAFASLRRALLPGCFGRDGYLTADVEEIEPEKPASVAERWLADEHVYIRSGEEMAQCLRALADKVENAGVLAQTYLSVNVQVSLTGGADDVERHTSVDALGVALGHTAVDKQGSYALKSSGSYHVSVYAPHRDQPADITPATAAAEVPQELAPLYDASVEDVPAKDDLFTRCQWVGGCDEPQNRERGNLLCDEHGDAPLSDAMAITFRQNRAVEVPK